MIKNFIIYGLIGWCIEIFWTGLGSLVNKNAKLVGTTSLWMFFIYGMAAFFKPLLILIGSYPLILRGVIYVFCFFAIEYLTGSLLNRFSICPWDYSGAKYNVRGVIRLDYAPLWFIAGLFFEFIFRKYMI